MAPRPSTSEMWLRNCITYLRCRRSAAHDRTVAWTVVDVAWTVVVVVAVRSGTGDILIIIATAAAGLDVAPLGLRDVCPLPLPDLRSPAA